MGKKLKKGRTQANAASPGSAKSPSPKKGKVQTGCLLAVLGVFLVVVITIVALYNRNKTQLYQMAIMAQATGVQDKLKFHQSPLTGEDQEKIAEILRDVQITAAMAPLDPQAAGQLKFVVGAAEEIVKEGNLQVEEVQKLQMQVNAVRQYLSKKATARPTRTP